MGLLKRTREVLQKQEKMKILAKQKRKELRQQRWESTFFVFKYLIVVPLIILLSIALSPIIIGVALQLAFDGSVVEEFFKFLLDFFNYFDLVS